MASIRREIALEAPAAAVWDAVRDVGRVHERFVRGFVVDTRMEGEDERVVTFANGMVARELIVDVDDGERRVAYSVVDGPARHHHATMQVIPAGEEACRLVWITDVFPHALAGRLAEMVDAGAAAMKRTLESPRPAPRG
jgi:hypothetical protein